MNNEIVNYQNKIKENLNILISQNKLDEAKEILNYYENIVKNDVDSYSIKGIIVMMEGNIAEAEKVLKEGLDKDGENFDLLYNLGYLYQFNAQNDLAIKYLKKALKNSKNESDSNTIYEMLRELGAQIEKKDQIKDLIPKTSIVILTYNNLEYNKLCIESIRKYTRKGTYEIIVVDNHSNDGTVSWLKQQTDIKLVLNDENFGFPKGCNQGIEVAEEGNDILLLNNDTIVTQNWLTNLKKCLYSENSIGAVGSVTNSCSNFQAILVDYTSLDEMYRFAERNNISNPNLWEERLRLVGFCMLIKNEVVQKVGLLDEIFTPGNFEDDDYSLRIRKAGYRLMLCKDSFIHHFGSISFGKVSKEYNELLIKNRKKFINKWDIDPYELSYIEINATEIFVQHNTSYKNILHINCSGGQTLLEFKKIYPDAKLYGLEENPKLVTNTKHFADIKTGSIDKINKFKEESFDGILLSRCNLKLEQLHSMILKLQTYCSQNGVIIIRVDKGLDIENDSFYNKLKENLKGNKINIYSDGLQKWIVIRKNRKNKNAVLSKLGKEELSKMNFEFKLENIKEMNLIYILRRIENKIDLDINKDYLTKVLLNEKININAVIELVKKHINNKGEILNIIGALFYNNNMKQEALKVLAEAYSFDNKNIDLVYNLASLLCEYGEFDSALDIIGKAYEMDEGLAQIREFILNTKEQNKGGTYE